MSDAQQEIRWVLRAQVGDREAFEKLLKSVEQPLFRYVSSLVATKHLAEDILQEVFVGIYRKLRWLREPELFRAWTYRIATREAFRQLKRQRKWQDHIDENATLEAVASPESGQGFVPGSFTKLPEWIARISTASRAVIVLHFLHEMTLEEVGAVLGIPIGTVKSRLAYGLQCLRRFRLEADELPNRRIT